MAAVATQVPQPTASTSYAFPKRVLSIPIVSSSIDVVHSTLSASPYTKGVYGVSQSLALQAYGTAANLSAPVYPHLEPVLLTADGYASKSLDIVEQRFPYPFQTPVETIYDDLSKAPSHAKDAAFQTYDQRIKTPAVGLAFNVDHRLAPLVDLLESILVKAHVRETSVPPTDEASSDSASGSSSASDSKVQILRAKGLIFDAKDRVVHITAEQAKALQSQNVYIQSASEHAKNLNGTLHTYYGNAQAGVAAYKGKGIELKQDVQERIHALSTNLLTELEKLQATTSSLPAHIQTRLQPLTTTLSSTVTELRTIITNPDAPLSDKAHQLGAAVQSRIGPVIEQARGVYQSAVDKYLGAKTEVTTEATSYAEAVKQNGEASH